MFNKFYACSYRLKVTLNSILRENAWKVKIILYTKADYDNWNTNKKYLSVLKWHFYLYNTEIHQISIDLI